MDTEIEALKRRVAQLEKDIATIKRIQIIRVNLAAAGAYEEPKSTRPKTKF